MGCIAYVKPGSTVAGEPPGWGLDVEVQCHVEEPGGQSFPVVARVECTGYAQ
jgi:hypothetical protein